MVPLYISQRMSPRSLLVLRVTPDLSQRYRYQVVQGASYSLFTGCRQGCSPSSCKLQTGGSSSHTPLSVASITQVEHLESLLPSSGLLLGAGSSKAAQRRGDLLERPVFQIKAFWAPYWLSCFKRVKLSAVFKHLFEMSAFQRGHQFVP